MQSDCNTEWLQYSNEYRGLGFKEGGGWFSLILTYLFTEITKL